MVSACSSSVRVGGIRLWAGGARHGFLLVGEDGSWTSPVRFDGGGLAVLWVADDGSIRLAMDGGVPVVTYLVVCNRCRGGVGDLTGR